MMIITIIFEKNIHKYVTFLNNNYPSRLFKIIECVPKIIAKYLESFENSKIK